MVIYVQNALRKRADLHAKKLVPKSFTFVNCNDQWTINIFISAKGAFVKDKRKFSGVISKFYFKFKKIQRVSRYFPNLVGLTATGHFYWQTTSKGHVEVYFYFDIIFTIFQLFFFFFKFL